jgi:hypothetical protein
MVYTVDDRQLLELWAVVFCFGHVREITRLVAGRKFCHEPRSTWPPSHRFEAFAARSGGLYPAEDIDA